MSKTIKFPTNEQKARGEMFNRFAEARQLELLNDYNAGKLSIATMVHTLVINEIDKIENGQTAIHIEDVNKPQSILNMCLIDQWLSNSVTKSQAYKDYVQKYFYNLEHRKDE